MNRFRYNAFLHDFPFLARIIGFDTPSCDWDVLSCDGLEVKPLDAELLAYTPVCEGATGSKVGIDNVTEVSFLLTDGRFIENAVSPTRYCRHNEAHTDDEFQEGESILEAIERRNVADKLAYIILLAYGYVIRDHYSLKNWRVTIYKPTRDVRIQQVVAVAQSKARLQVRAEADF